MFERKAKISARIAGGIDLLIDTATLGEYGLEPVANEDCTSIERRRQPASARHERRACAAHLRSEAGRCRVAS